MAIEEMGIRTPKYIRADYKNEGTLKLNADDKFFSICASRGVKLGILRRIYPVLAQKSYPRDGEFPVKYIINDGKFCVVAARTSFTELTVYTAFHTEFMKKDAHLEVIRVSKPNLQLTATKHFSDRCACRKPNLRLIETIDKQFTGLPLSDGYLVSDSKHSIIVNKATPSKCVLITCYENDIDNWEDFKFIREHVKHRVG